MAEYTQRIAVLLAPRTLRQLRKLARADGRNLSSYVRHLIELAVADQKPEGSPRVGRAES